MYWPDEAIASLSTGGVKVIGLGYDLGNDDRGSGYHVGLWIGVADFLRGFRSPKMLVHSANSSARLKMEAGIAAIEKPVRAE